MEELIVDLMLTIVKAFIKNPTSAAKYKAALQEIAAAIDAMYPPGS